MMYTHMFFLSYLYHVGVTFSQLGYVAHFLLDTVIVRPMCFSYVLLDLGH